MRVHTDPLAASAADAVNANAFTVGQEIFFANGLFEPHTRDGQRLLAHELSHTVQQAGYSGQAIPSIAASQAVYRDTPQNPAGSRQAPEAATADNSSKTVTVDVPPDLALWLKIHFLNIPDVQLTPPSLLTPPAQPSIYSPGTLSPGAGSGSQPFSYTPPASGTQTPVLTPPASPLSPTAGPNPALTPGGSGSPAQSPAAPTAPDRLALKDLGPISLGARIGFPSAPQTAQPDGSPSALQESLRKANILSSLITGKPPAMPSPDPGQLVGAVWGIFSTRIAPGYAAMIANKMSSKPSSGVGFQLDATILLNLPKVEGAGGTLTVTFP